MSYLQWFNLTELMNANEWHSNMNWIENIILIVISNVFLFIKGLMAENERQNHMIKYLLHNEHDKSQPDSFEKKSQPGHGKILLDLDSKH